MNKGLTKRSSLRTTRSAGIIHVGNKGSINNYNTFDIQNDAQLLYTTQGNPSDETSSFINTATLKKSAGAAGSESLISLLTFASGRSATILCQAGQLDFKADTTVGPGNILNGSVEALANATVLFSVGFYPIGELLTLTGEGTKTLNGATFRVSSNSTLQLTQGVFEFDGANISADGAVNVRLDLVGGTMNWRGGSLTPFSPQGLGLLQVGPDGTLNIPGNNQTFLTGWNLRNRGTVNWSGDHNFNCGSGTHILNEGIMTISGFPDFLDTSGGTNPPTFSNSSSGLFTKGPAISFTRMYVDLTNSGMLEVQGDLRFYGNYQDAAVDSAILDVANKITFELPTTINGKAKGNGTLDSATATPTTNNGSTEPGKSPGQLNIVGGYTLGSTHNFIVKSAGTGQGTTYDFLNQSGGTLTLGGTLTVNLLSGFTPTAANTFTVAGSAVRSSAHSGT